MRGPLTHLSEVVRSPDQAFAEVPFPDSVDHHASGRGMTRCCQPLRQAKAAAAGSDWRALRRGRHEHLGKSLRRIFTGAVIVATYEDFLLDGIALLYRTSHGRL